MGPPLIVTLGGAKLGAEPRRSRFASIVGVVIDIGCSDLRDLKTLRYVPRPMGAVAELVPPPPALLCIFESWLM